MTGSAGILTADPTALLKVLLLDDLAERAANQPSAAIAILDVLAPLVPEPDDALDLKESAIEFALRSSNSGKPRFVLEAFDSIAQRCARAAFRHFREIRHAIGRRMAELASKAPRDALALLNDTRSRRTHLYAAISRGLTRMDVDAVPALLEFALQSPGKMAILLRRSPYLLRACMENLGINSGTAQLDQAGPSAETLATWFSIVSESTRHRMAQGLFGSPALRCYPALFRAAIEQARSEDVEAIFATAVQEPLSKEICGYIYELISRFPDSALNSLLKTVIDSKWAAQLLARALPLHASGVDLIESVHAPNDCAKLWVFMDFLERPGCIHGLGPALCRVSARWISRLIRQECADDRQISTASTLLTQCGGDGLLDELSPDEQALPYWQPLKHELGKALFHTLSQSYIAGHCEEEIFRTVDDERYHTNLHP